MSSRPSIWFWQRILTPHMGALAAAVAERGYSVTFVANARMSANRAAQGWEAPALGKAQFELAISETEIGVLVEAAPIDSIHLCQGLRGNALVGQAQRLIRQRGLRHWAILESLDDSGWAGIIRRALYRNLLRRWGSQLEGVLAIGWNTPEWIAALGLPRARIIPFAYFLSDVGGGGRAEAVAVSQAGRPFRFMFVGQLVKLKRVAALVEALAELNGADVELWVVGGGPLEASLKAQAARLLPGRVNWLGVQPMSAVPALMAQADCLLLPSRHDGWGAVVSESLMVGTPAICSDACGSATAVQASGVGGVFVSGDKDDLVRLMRQCFAKGKISPNERMRISSWATSLGADAGAQYLVEILLYASQGGSKPMPPWGCSGPSVSPS